MDTDEKGKSSYTEAPIDHALRVCRQLDELDIPLEEKLMRSLKFPSLHKQNQ